MEKENIKNVIDSCKETAFKIVKDINLYGIGVCRITEHGFENVDIKDLYEDDYGEKG